MSWYIEKKIASLRIFTLCSDVDEFQLWLKRYPALDQTIIFPGYKFFVNLIAVMFVDSFVRENPFDLSEDPSFYSAISRGIPLEDIPNNCEKVIFLKNLWRNFESVNSSKNWDELKDNLHKSNEVISFFNKIYGNLKIETEKEIPEKELLSFIIKKTAVNYLNDISQGIPNGAIATVIPPFCQEPGATFVGYVYSLEFLWFKLLGEKKFRKSPVKELHNVKTMLKPKEISELIAEFNEFHEDDPESKEWHIYHNALDSFFSKIYEKEIEPLDNQLKQSDISFTISKKIDKKAIKFLLDQKTVLNPAYLTNETNEELIFKKLDYFFEWCPFNVLDSEKSYDYSGVYGFITFLTGLSTSKKISKDNLIHVLRIRHIVRESEGYFYSYAILNECYFFGGQEAGWIIFLTCATDYSGHGGMMHELAELYIEEYEKKGKLSVKQVDVDEKTFRKYLKKELDDYPRILEEDDELEPDEVIESYQKMVSTYQELITNIEKQKNPQPIQLDAPHKITSLLAHKFKIAMSFSGEHRDLVENIARELTKKLGENTVFYDNFYRPLLAQFDLDLAFEKIYKYNSELIVVFLSSDYGKRNWCITEYRIIRALRFQGHNEKIMLLKVEDCEIPGLYETDGYLSIQEMSTHEIIENILQRIE
jgi:hypothetical protein